ncbi:hypothetical protein K6119_01715 [Paracrocinitomix mangrovi]|uniref:hypothetical protein n=1 Tax=Paracrocinitomix mangrovi TaxID=2862509 RepID=UPI001C8E862A|nr:hypothetical protein [Paracrocinitomix mangrovi]UKN02234.1 hypothetical protein K6119_01715 [Paracrocinitomix mangrovi]
MKTKVLFLSMIAGATIIASCKKDIYGCMDENADNYSAFANIDDGSCVYPSDNVYVGTGTANWQLSGYNYYTTFNVPDITQDVVDVGAVLVYALTANNTYELMPFTIYQSSSYSTTISFVYTVGNVTIWWADSDQSQPSFPWIDTFKIVVIKHKNQVNDPEIKKDIKILENK